jgi:hypothetical protein
MARDITPDVEAARLDDDDTALVRAVVQTARSLLADAADGRDPKRPYGNVEYADPGYQDDKVKRYPIDTEEHVRAAWSYINKRKNAAKYTPEQLARIKARIKRAAKRFGIEISEDADDGGAKAARRAVADVAVDRQQVRDAVTALRGLLALIASEAEEIASELDADGATGDAEAPSLTDLSLLLDAARDVIAFIACEQAEHDPKGPDAYPYPSPLVAAEGGGGDDGGGVLFRLRCPECGKYMRVRVDNGRLRPTAPDEGRSDASHEEAAVAAEHPAEHHEGASAMTPTTTQTTQTTQTTRTTSTASAPSQVTVSINAAPTSPAAASVESIVAALSEVEAGLQEALRALASLRALAAAPPKGDTSPSAHRGDGSPGAIPADNPSPPKSADDLDGDVPSLRGDGDASPSAHRGDGSPGAIPADNPSPPKSADDLDGRVRMAADASADGGDDDGRDERDEGDEENRGGDAAKAHSGRPTHIGTRVEMASRRSYRLDSEADVAAWLAEIEARQQASSPLVAAANLNQIGQVGRGGRAVTERVGSMGPKAPKAPGAAVASLGEELGGGQDFDLRVLFQR